MGFHLKRGPEITLIVPLNAWVDSEKKMSTLKHLKLRCIQFNSGFNIIVNLILLVLSFMHFITVYIGSSNKICKLSKCEWSFLN